MRYLLFAALALVAIALILVLIGWMLLQRHRAARQATYRATPEVLFGLINNAADFPTWRPSVKRVELLEDEGGHRRFRETGRDGKITYQIDKVVPGRLLVTRISDSKLPFGGTWTYELTSVQGSPSTSSGQAGSTTASTTLRITEDGEVYNPIFRLVSRFILGHHATIDTYLRDLGTRLGQQVVPDSGPD
jgi:uncharacterized protein YndB with AHSA1/START domain